MKVALLTLFVALSAFAINLSASADPECVYRQIRDLPMHWSNPLDCSKYYRCTNKNVKREVACAAKKEYNPKTGKCSSAGKGYCKLTLAAPIAGVENACADKPSGAYVPQANNCRDYFICNDNVAFPQICDAGSFFNATSEVCVPDTNAVCWQNYCLNQKDGTYLADRASCLNFYICDKSNVVQQVCNAGSYFNTTEMNCQPDLNNAICWENFCIGKANGTLVKNPNDCHAYYVCNNEQATAQQCIEGSYFDWNQNQCLNGTCPDNETTPETPCEPTPTPTPTSSPLPSDCTCPGGYKEGEFLPDPTSCMHYLICSGGVLQRNACGNGLFYNATLQVCQPDTENKCPQCNSNYRRAKRSLDNEKVETLKALQNKNEEEETNKETQAQVELLKAELTDVPKPVPETAVVAYVEPAVAAAPSGCTCPGGYASGQIVSHPTDCDKYYVCENGVLILRECGNGYRYSSKYEVCVPDDDYTCWPKPTDCGCTEAPPNTICAGKPNGLVIANPQNCTNYYTCNNNVAIEGACSFDKWFNPATQTCEFDFNATCINPCSCSKGISFKPHPDCNKFYFCNDGEAHVETCPNGLGFNEAYSACMKNATCTSNMCFNKPDGYTIPDVEDKTKFFVCLSNVAVQVDCPASTQYNPIMQICMPSPSANCNQAPCLNGTNAQPYATLDNSPNSFCYCRNNGAFETNCLYDYVFNPNIGICYSNSACDVGLCYTHDEYYVSPNRDNPDGFCLCVAKTQVQVNCPCGLTFNQHAGLCLPPVTQDSRCNPTFCLNEPDNTITSSPVTNAGFCVCQYGGSTYHDCGPNQTFLPDMGLCFGSTAEIQCDVTKCAGTTNNIFETLNDPYAFCYCENDTSVVIKDCPAGSKFNSATSLCLREFCDNSFCTASTLFIPYPAIDYPYGFCLCQGNEANLKTCTNGTIYDDSVGACVIEAKLECNLALCQAPNRPYPYDVPAMNDEYSFCYCYSSDHVQLFNCPAGKIYDQAYGRCVSETNPNQPGCGGSGGGGGGGNNNNQCTCPGGYPAGTFQPHPTNCNQYYICENGQLQLQTCGQSEYYNPSLGLCVRDTLGVCNNKSSTCTCVGAYKENELIANAHNRNSYFRCLNSQLHEERCAPNYYFDPIQKACYSEFNTRKFYMPRSSVGVGIGVAEAAPRTEDFFCEDNEKRSVPSNCSQYEVCVDSMWQRRSCSKERYYNPERRQCLEPRDDTVCNTARVLGLPMCSEDTEDQTLPHKYVTKCGLYYRCKQGKWHLKSCGEQEFYARELRTCRRTKLKNICEARNASEIELQKLDEQNLKIPTKCQHTAVRAFAAQCDMYLMCLEGEWWYQYCPLGMYFDVELNYCKPNLERACQTERSQVKGLKGQQQQQTVMEGFTSNNCMREGAQRPSALACNKYFECVNGQWLQKTCSQVDFYYNVTAETCLPDTMGICAELGQVCRPGEQREYPLNCTAYELCDEHGVWQRKNCATRNSTYDVLLQQCVDNVPKEYCASNGLRRACRSGEMRAWPLKTNCTKFYYCEADIWQQGACLEGHTYVNELRTCVPHAANDTCKPIWHTTKNLTVPLPTQPVKQQQQKQSQNDKNVCAQKSDGAAVPHADDCTRFYLCLHQQSIGEQHCVAGSFFDETLGYCRPNDGSCKPPLMSLCKGALDGQFVADPNDCRNYYKCALENDATPQLMHCNDGQYFHVSLQQCRIDRGECQAGAQIKPPLKCANESEHGVKLPHERYCNIYYACVRGLAIPVECNDGYEFNPVLSRCQLDVEKQCENGELVNGNETTYSCGNLIDGTYLPNNGDCTRYFICSNGHAQPKRCAAKAYFDSQQLLCVPDDGSCPYVDQDDEEPKGDGDGNGDDDNTKPQPPDPKVCEGKHGQMMPDLANCNEFYVCINGKLRHERCYEHFYFDIESNQCRSHESAGGTITTTTVTTSMTTTTTFATRILSTSTMATTTAGSSTTAPFIETASSVLLNDATTSEPLSIAVSIAQSQRCLDKPTNFTALCGQIAEGSSIAEQGDCRRYISCEENEPISQRCRNGESYDSLLGICRQNDGTCMMENGQRVGVCNGLHGSLTRNAENCRAYFVCINGQKIAGECAESEFFDRISRKCQVDETNQCSLASKKANNNVPCKGLSETMLYPYVKDGCRSYFKCVKGVATIHECADGLFFNATTSQCVKEISECKMLNLSTATTTTTTATTTIAQTNLHRAPENAALFNGEMEKEMLCKNAHFGRPYANIKDNCRSYYVCDGPDSIVYTSCPKGTLYSSEKRACAAAKHVQCKKEN